jgi:hypothetical protein
VVSEWLRMKAKSVVVVTRKGSRRLRRSLVSGCSRHFSFMSSILVFDDCVMEKARHVSCCLSYPVCCAYGPKATRTVHSTP